MHKDCKMSAIIDVKTDVVAKPEAEASEQEQGTTTKNGATDGRSPSKKKAKKTDYEEDLRGAMVQSATVAENSQHIYAKFRELVGPPETDEDGRWICSRCDEPYKESENKDGACFYYKSHHDGGYRVHKGLYRTDYGSDFWYGWHEANPPMESAYWKSERQGGHKWTGCGCTANDQDECEREGKHYPEGYPPSDDEWCEEESAELSDGEFDEEQSKQSGQKLLVDDYIRSLASTIEQKLGSSKQE